MQRHIRQTKRSAQFLTRVAPDIVHNCSYKTQNYLLNDLKNMKRWIDYISEKGNWSAIHEDTTGYDDYYGYMCAWRSNNHGALGWRTRWGYTDCCNHCLKELAEWIYKWQGTFMQNC